MIRRLHTIGLMLLTLSAFTFYGCNGSKALTKKGNKLNEAGLYSEAANMYYTALRKNNSNVDAKIGMKSTGQFVLNNFLDKFASARNMGQKKDAVYRFLEAEEYYKKVKSAGVELNLAAFYFSDFESIKSDYLDDLYEEGSQLLEEEKYQNAHSIFEEISRLDPEFKDAGELKDIAYLEPLYDKGINAKSAERYREALGYFNKVSQRNSNYKEVAKLIPQVIEAGRFSVAVLPFVNSTNQNGLDAKLSAYALEALASVDDPFIKVVDRENLQQILDEQIFGLSGAVDENTAVAVGELMGANAIVTGTVLNYNLDRGKLKSANREAFESYQVKKFNEVEQKYFYETKYKKSSYQEFYNENKANISFQFKVISLQTGEVLLTKIIDQEEKDAVNFINYEGDASKLYPAVDGGISMSKSLRSELASKVSARKELISVDDLSNTLYRNVGASMTNEIESVLQKAIK